MKSTGDRAEHDIDRLLSRECSRPAATAEACPPAEVLSAWFDRALPVGEADGVETHLASCARCQDVVGHLARTEPEVLYVRARPAPVRWTWHLRWAVPLAAAAILPFIVGTGTRSLLAPGVTDPERPAPAAAASGPIAKNDLDRQLPAPLALPPAAGRDVASTVAPPLRLQGQKASTKVEQSPRESAPFAAPERAVAEGAAATGIAVEMRRADASREDRPAAPPLPGVGGTIVVPERPAKGRAPTLAALQPAATEPAAAASAFVPGSPVGWRYARPGVVLRTSDGGGSWTQQALPANLRLLSVSAVSPSICWAAGPSGAIVRTLDGVTWQVISAPTTADLVSIAALDERRATVRTADGLTYDTGDGGSTWRRR